MKKIIDGPAAELSMRYLDPNSARRIRAWCDALRRWDEDEAVRSNSLALPNHPGVFVLRTTTDVRVFFRIDGDTVTVIDVTTAPVILASGGVGGAADASLVHGDMKGG
jgi:hypothetical protein